MDERLSSVRVYYHIVTKSFTATMLSTFDVLNSPDMYVDQVFPVEQAEMTSSTNVDDYNLLSAANSACHIRTLEAFCQRERDFSQCSTSAVASVPVPGPLTSTCTDHGDYNDDSWSNTDTASETSASPYDCSDGSATSERRRRCSTFSRRPSVGYHGGRRREQPPAVFASLAEKRAWERERLKKDNHNTIERRRRYNINDRIHELASLLPKHYRQEGRSWNKGEILKCTVDYVRRLHSQQHSLFAMLERNRLLEQHNQQLRDEVKNLLILATGQLRQIVDESSCSDGIHMTAGDDKTLVDMVTGCHDNDIDAIACDMPPSPHHYHHHHHHHHQQQQQQQQRSVVDNVWSNTSASHVCPELFLNNCDENITSLSSSSSPPSAAAASAVPSHFPLTSVES